MQEAMLIIPARDNAGNDLSALRRQIAGAMVAAFGGATMVSATGFWNSADGRLFEEPITQLVSACDDTETNRATLRDLAAQIGRDGHQLAVYCRYPNGRVEIIDSAEKRRAA